MAAYLEKINPHFFQIKVQLVDFDRIFIFFSNKHI